MATEPITVVVNTPSAEIVKKSDDNVFTGDNTFNGSININGGLKEKVTAVTDTYQVLTSDVNVIGNKATAFTITLPVGVVGQVLYISNIGAGVITLEGSGSETIDGELNQAINQNESVTVLCYELTKWIIK